MSTSDRAPRARRPALPARLDPRAGDPPRAARRAPRPATGGRARVRAAPRRSGGTRVAIAARVVAGPGRRSPSSATSGWGWYLGRVADASVNRTDAIPTERQRRTSASGEAMNLLLVGNDSRASATAGAARRAQHHGTRPGINTDTMILVHVPADGSKASFVSFPRDSYVRDPRLRQDKLNAAYAYGYQYEAGDGATEDAERRPPGAQLLVQTISGLTGLQIDHYAEVDLLGFFNLSSVVGGVEVNLCDAGEGRATPASTCPAGVQTIERRAGAGVRPAAARAAPRRLRPDHPPAGVHRRHGAQDAVATTCCFDLGKQRELVAGGGRTR